MSRWGATPIAFLIFFLCTRAGCSFADAFEGEIAGDGDLSAVAAVGDVLVIGSDEERHVQILKKRDDGRYGVVGDPVVLRPSGDEIDIEAITASGTRVYVAGSHSLKRKKVKSGPSHLENRERILSVKRDDNRFFVFRFDIDPETGTASDPEAISLEQTLRRDPLLERFTKIPGKENGVDIEGIAVAGGKLYVGFRSPVLRLNYVPVLVTTFENPLDHELLYVNLGGLGIRDMVSTPDGFMLLAGPPGDADGTYALFLWDGKDFLPGSGAGRAEQLMTIEPPPDAKAEGLALIRTEGRCHDLLIVFDGVERGAPRTVRACTD